MGKTKYSDEEKAQVYGALAVFKGNVKATATNLGLPQQTVRDWKKSWERDGIPEVILDKSKPILDEFYDRAVRIRDILLDTLEKRIEIDDITTKDVITSIGIFTDKIRLIEGLPTARQETVSSGVDPEELGRALARIAKGAIEVARERQFELDVIEDTSTG